MIETLLLLYFVSVAALFIWDTQDLQNIECPCCRPPSIGTVLDRYVACMAWPVFSPLIAFIIFYEVVVRPEHPEPEYQEW